MLRMVIVGTLAMLLSGCIGGSNLSYSNYTSYESPSDKCKKYGHFEGTSAYATCIGNESRAAEERAYQLQKDRAEADAAFWERRRERRRQWLLSDD